MRAIPYGRQFIDQDDIEAVTATLKSDFLTQGPEIPLFEQELADYHKAKYAVLFSNGTAALHGCYAVLEQAEGEIIVPPLTFVASSNAAIYAGLKPRFADIEASTLSISLEEIKKVKTPQTKAITTVSFAGYMPDLKELYNWCASQEIALIHDAAHAIGARHAESNVADHCDMAILSFHPVKHLTTGEGGAVLTNNETFYNRLLTFRTHGITRDPALFKTSRREPWVYEMQSLGYNYRLCDIQASLGRSQLKKLNLSLYRRHEIATFYDRELSSLPLILPFKEIYSSADYLKSGIEEARELANCHSYHLYPILLANKEERLALYLHLKEKGIYTQVHYIPAHLMPYYRENWGTKSGTFPVAESFYERELSLPIFLGLENFEITYVVTQIKEFFKSRG